jgi:hypothetical protein
MRKFTLLCGLILLTTWLALGCEPKGKSEIVSLRRPRQSVGERRLWRFVIRHLVESCSGRHGAQAGPASLVSPIHQQAQGVWSWRCKECHGWDYRVKMGPTVVAPLHRFYRSVARRPKRRALRNWLQPPRTSNPGHDFLRCCARLISLTSRTFKHGLVDMAQYIDYKTKKPVGGR